MNQNRLKNVRLLMEQQNIRQLIVTAPQSIWYLTGQWVQPMDRLDALIIGPEDCRLLCYMLAQAYCEGCETVVYTDESQTVEQLSRLLQAVPTGVDGALHARFLLPLLEARSDIAFRASACVEQARSRKDGMEMDRLRNASQVTDAVLADAFARLTEGITERQFSKTVADAFERAGAGIFEGSPMCAFGEGTAEPHHSPGNRKLRAGDAVLVDTGMRIGGYYSDMTRTVFFREADPEQQHVYDVVRQANKAAINAAEPGVFIAELDRAARSVIEQAGYGEYFTHKTSHGLGIDFHEEPFDRPHRHIPVQPGMCFTIEPGIYLPGRFGVRIEDALLMGEHGAEVLNQFPKELKIVP